jgi:uncharacterized damage-inducible protein DinB
MPMFDLFKTAVRSQFEAALWMLHDCITRCPAEHWSGPTSIVAKYEFWHVAYHTLYCTDGYLSRDAASHTYPPRFYPGGASDADDEYPSRRMERSELIEFTQHCLAKLRSMLEVETAETLAGPCGFPHKTFSRGEMYLYNMRHVMHHTGQLSAHLRRLKLDEASQPRWASAGWK